jgi:exosortase
MGMERPAATRGALYFWAAFFAALFWAYWPPFGEMARKWLNDPQYSHAYFVPVFSLALVWMRRKELAECQSSAPLAGLGALLLAGLMRFGGAAVYMDWLETISLLPALAGGVLIVWGWPGLARTWGAVAFLFFMVPLPYRAEMALSHPLQRMATKSSTFVLQTIGFPAFAEGNVIVLNDSRIGIIEACNGLGMLILFFALAVGLAMVVTRPLLDRALIVLSAAPIAVLSNTIRITFTSIVHDKMGAEYGEALGHNQGWLMMPIALALLWAELKLLAWVLIEEEDDGAEEAPLFGAPPAPKSQEKKERGQVKAGPGAAVTR